MQKELIMTNNPKDLQSLYLDIVAETVRFAAPRDNNADPLANYEALFGRSLPRLIGVSSGGSLQVTEELDQLITKVANILYDNSGRTETHSAEEYRKIVRAAFGDPLVRLDLRRDKEELAADLKEAVDVRVSNHFEENVRVYAFSCSMFEDGVFEPFSIGPVTFSSRQAWLQLSEQNGLVDAKTAERARQRLAGTDLDALTGAEASYEKSLFDLILEPRRNICSVETKSLGVSTSEKRAVETANLAITVLSLFEPSASRFHRSAFLAYDTSPHLKQVMSFTRDRKVFPGFSRSHYPPSRLDAKKFSAFLRHHKPELNVAGDALSFGVLADNHLPRPKVSHAIRTSLNWFRRGCIDNDDRVAVVFLSASLDALSPKGKLAGITELVCQTLGKKPMESLWIGGPQIKTILKAVYDDGRSRLIHGSSDQTNKDWSQLRNYAELIAKWCLLGALIYFAKNPACDELKALSLPAT